MRYTPIESDFYVHNRKVLAEKLLPESIGLIFSNEVLPTNADGVMGFRQNNDLFYLTGIDQEETALFLCPEHPEEDFREILFVRETNEKIKVWEGEKLSKTAVTAISGVRKVMWFHQLEGFLKRHVLDYEHIYINLNEHDGADFQFRTTSLNWLRRLRESYALHTFKRISPLIRELRLLKQPAEIKQLKKAVGITKNAFQRVARFMKPGVYEFEIEAELTHEFLKNRSRGHAFQPIVASGKNACTLHYITNNEICKSGDLVLLDFGAEYGNYNADVTRCLPVNGKFTKRQAEVYNAVLRILKASKVLMVAGKTLQQLKQEVNELFKEELINLQLYSVRDFANAAQSGDLIQRYFPHGISHHLGLDVHDVSNRYATLKAGNLLTCEPGIYIPDEGIGVRLENDILLTEYGNEDLMHDFPLEIEEIETLMNFKKG